VRLTPHLDAHQLIRALHAGFLPSLELKRPLIARQNRGSSQVVQGTFQHRRTRGLRSDGRVGPDGRVGQELADLLSTAARDGDLGRPLKSLFA
jgi:hypothetical protein